MRSACCSDTVFYARTEQTLRRTACTKDPSLVALLSFDWCSSIKVVHMQRRRMLVCGQKHTCDRVSCNIHLSSEGFIFLSSLSQNILKKMHLRLSLKDTPSAEVIPRVRKKWEWPREGKEKKEEKKVARKLFFPLSITPLRGYSHWCSGKCARKLQYKREVVLHILRHIGGRLPF